MNMLILAAGVEIVKALNLYGPTVAKEIAAIFYKENPSLEDWNKALDLAKTEFDKGLLPGVLIQPPSIPTTGMAGLPIPALPGSP